MRTARLKAPPDHPSASYHCVSRVVDRRFIFGPEEKDHFVRLLRECEAFCRVRILTFAVMANHFHVLVEVSRRPAPDLLPSPEQVLADLRQLSGHQFPQAVEQRFHAFREANDPTGLAAYLATFHARMYDLSSFMKLVKQRFTQWYNARTGRKGTLWEDRFKSVLVEGRGHALTTMAAYIDLNPVRAGLVSDPKDYRWSGYGEAVAGRKRARLGIQALVQALHRGREASSSRSLAEYRMRLYLEGNEGREAIGEDGRPVRGTLPREDLVKVLAARGRLPLREYLRCRVRYFCDGAVLGGRDYVERIFAAYRDRFGPKRTTGARRMKGLDEGGLFTLRDLRRGVFG